ncbi:uncharacterized protein METZ01_LOCUS221196, partial [marine metagenome]
DYDWPSYYDKAHEHCAQVARVIMGN